MRAGVAHHPGIMRRALPTTRVSWGRCPPPGYHGGGFAHHPGIMGGALSGETQC